MAVQAESFCLVNQGSADIIAGYYDKIRVVCGDGEGNFDNVDEEHGGSVGIFDYLFDPRPGDLISANRVEDIKLVFDGRLFVYGEREGIITFSAGNAYMNSGASIGNPEVGVGELEILVHSPSPGDTMWKRISFVGKEGLGVLR